MSRYLFAAVLLLVLGSAVPPLAAQTSLPGSSDPSAEQQGETKTRDYSGVINEMFAPITDKLNLTKEQQFQIIAIITETEVRATPLAQALALADQELSELAFTGPLD